MHLRFYLFKLLNLNSNYSFLTILPFSKLNFLPCYYFLSSIILPSPSYPKYEQNYSNNCEEKRTLISCTTKPSDEINNSKQHSNLEVTRSLVLANLKFLVNDDQNKKLQFTNI